MKKFKHLMMLVNKFYNCPTNYNKKYVIFLYNKVFVVNIRII